MSAYEKINNLTGILLFLFTTTVYVFTLAPTASFWDSGELVATAYKLQIPHPPGAPLFLLAGRLFSFLSFGDKALVAFCINMLSAVSSGLAVMFLYWTIVLLAAKMFTGKPAPSKYNLLCVISGITGALAFAFTDSFWYSATETEVYALSTLFTAVVFWAILRWEKAGDSVTSQKWLILIAYLMGLSVGVHLLNLLAIPSIALVYYFKKHPRVTWLGMVTTLATSAGILLFILYGLVGGANLTKTIEIFMVNNLGLPFGSGIVFSSILLVAGIGYVLIYSIRKGNVTLNTVTLCLAFLAIGYSSYTLVPVRAGGSPPINQNNPDNILRFLYYLNMEQYPSRPLFMGHYFTAQLQDQVQGKPVYEKGADKYVIKDHKITPVYDENHTTVFPRMYSQAGHAEEYRRIAGLEAGEKPSFFDNISYYLRHQIGHMYLRYFLWNFSGREGSIMDAGPLFTWDAFEEIPEILSLDKARNNYLMLPLLLGLAGIFYLFRRSRRTLFVTGILFLMTGVALVTYINAPPTEPRERDYIYVGSYYAFSIFIGIGFLGLLYFLQQLFKIENSRLTITAITFSLLVPAVLFFENLDDHNRSQRYFSVDQARNMLGSCAPNAILFTGGDNDTYPLWYVQEVEGFRTDVRVIVLSYANAEWYINQFYQEINQSAPLPLSLKKAAYRQGGLNDYLPVIKNQNIKGAIDTSQLLKLIDREHPALQVSTRFDRINSIPGDLLVSEVDPKAQTLLPDKFKPLFSEELVFRINGNGLQKKDLLILDLIDTNRWERPLYFNITSLNTVNFDISQHIVQEGDVYRLLPVTNTSGEMLVDSRAMYQNLMRKGTWRNLDNENIYYSAFYRNFISNQRRNFNILAMELLHNGETEKAQKVIDTVMSIFPDKSLPYDFNSIDTVNILLALDKEKTANHLSQTISRRADEFLHYLSENEQQHWLNRQKSISLFSLRKLANIYKNYGFDEKALKYNRLFTIHYEQLHVRS